MLTARRFRWTLAALASHYRRHPWQALFLLAGLVAGVGLWSAVQVLNAHARASYADADAVLGAQASAFVRSRGGEGVAVEDYVALRRHGFRQLFPLVQARVATADNTPLALIATDLLALPPGVAGAGVFDEAGMDWSAFAAPPWQAWYPSALAGELGVAAGERLALRDGRRLPPAVIAARAQQGRQVFMDVGAAFALLGRERFTSLAVGPMDAQARARLEAALPAGLVLEPNRQRLDLTALTASLHTHLTAMSLLSFAVGLFIVFNAVRFSLWFRRPTLRTLRLLGVSVRGLALAVLAETLAWSTLGTALGLAAGHAIAQALLPGVGATLQNLYGAVVGAEVALHSRTVLLAWMLTLAGLAVALAWPLLLQLRGRPLPAGTDLAQWIEDRRARRRLALGGALLALGAAIIHTRMSSVAAGFVMLGLLLFAAAALLPALLAVAHALCGRLLGGAPLLVRWTLSDARAQLPGLRAAMMALLLALTANLGVESLVASFRGALADWLEQRIGADLYVNSPRLDAAGFAAGADWLAASHARIGVDTRWGERPALVRGVDPAAPDMRALPLAAALPDALARWAAGGAVLANEQARHLGGLALGGTVSLASDEGPVDYTVAGFFHDYGNAHYQFYLPREEVARRWRHARPQGLLLWLAPGVPLARAEAALAAAGAQPGEWTAQRDIKAQSMKIFDRTFAITAAMNTLTLGVAGAALLTALLAIVHERLPEFARWRALGVRRREVLAVLAAPLGLFVGLTWLLALPLGALLAWLLIHELNIVAFGWTMPMRWSAWPALRLGVLVAAVVALVLAVVAAQLRRRIPQAMAKLGAGL